MSESNKLVDVSSKQLCGLKCFSVQVNGAAEATTYDLNMADLSVMLKLADVGVICTDDPTYTLVQHGACYGVVYSEIIHKGKHAVALTEVGNRVLVTLFGSSDIRSYRALLNPTVVPASATR